MKKLYYIICSKYRKFEKPKILCLLKKTFGVSIICSKCKNKSGKIFKEKGSIKILKIIGSINNIEKHKNI